jgi:hypothetical protein
MGMVLFKVIAYLLQVRCGSRGPADAHSGAKHFLETSIHFVFFDELATVRLRNAFPHSGAEMSIFGKKA